MSSTELQFLNQLCKQLYDCKTLEKFNLCKLVRLCLSDQPNVDSIKDDTWPSLVRDSLFEILRNKLTNEYRDEALQLATQMTLSFDGMEWIRCDRWEEDNSKFFVLLLRLVCIEVQLLLPRLLEDQTDCSSKMGSLLILLEKLLFALINNLNGSEEEGDEPIISEDVLKIDSATVINSINAIRETMREVIGFIKEVSFLKGEALSTELQSLLLATIRLLCAYTVEEPEELKDQTVQVLPFILKTLHHNSNTEMDEVKQNALDIVKRLYSDETSKELMLQHGITFDAISEKIVEVNLKLDCL